jgi:xylulokinase
LWPQIVSDVTGLPQDVREGPSQAGVGAALLAAVSVRAATLQTTWPQATVRVEPDSGLRDEYDQLYGWFRELADATTPHAHALAAWQRKRSRGRMAPAADQERGGAAGVEGRRPS